MHSSIRTETLTSHHRDMGQSSRSILSITPLWNDFNLVDSIFYFTRVGRSHYMPETARPEPHDHSYIQPPAQQPPYCRKHISVVPYYLCIINYTERATLLQIFALATSLASSRIVVGVVEYKAQVNDSVSGVRWVRCYMVAGEDHTVSGKRSSHAQIST
jgi:hypothetical protein